MLGAHLLLQWYSLSDPAMEEALIEVPSMRRFAGIDLISDWILEETTIITLRHLLEKHGRGEQIFETVKAHLSARGMMKRQGDDRGCHLDRGAQLHQEQGWQARSREASDQERQPVVNRHESPRRRG
jgi:IS5 family transposase